MTGVLILSIVFIAAGACVTLVTLVLLLVAAANSTAAQARRLNRVLTAVLVSGVVGVAGGTLAAVMGKIELAAALGLFPVVGCGVSLFVLHGAEQAELTQRAQDEAAERRARRRRAEAPTELFEEYERTRDGDTTWGAPPPPTSSAH